MSSPLCIKLGQAARLLEINKARESLNKELLMSGKFVYMYECPGDALAEDSEGDRCGEEQRANI